MFELAERLVVGGHDVTDEVIQRLKDMQALRVLQATKQIAQAAKVGSERRIMRDERGNAGAAVKMQIHPASYHYWGQRLGYKCWNDEQFCREYLRDNPASRIKTVTERPTFQIGWTGGGKRETKVYNN